MKRQLLALSLMSFLLVNWFSLSLASAEFNDTISPEDKAAADKMLEPVMKIYTLVKYIATFIAVLMVLFAGVSYIMSGSDPKKRDNSKNMITYVAIGLVIIWAAPLFVQFIIG